MVTLKDVEDLDLTVEILGGRYGATPQFAIEYEERYGRLIEVIARENELADIEEIRQLPPSTLLGPLAECEFLNFQEWVKGERAKVPLPPLKELPPVWDPKSTAVPLS